MQLTRRVDLIQGAILLLALVRGLLYASAMPPWSIIDEQQHVHYVQSLAETGRIPTAGITYISDEIARASATRSATLHWSEHTTQEPQHWGLEGNSYEGYQPPLFYLLMAPVYLLLPGDMLSKLYGLRWTMVALSLITVWLCMAITQRVFPSRPLLPYLTALVLVAIPERTLATSRVNNDVLTEVLAALFILQLTAAILGKISVRSSVGLGVVFGLGMLTKLSFAVLAPLLLILVWQHRKSLGIRRCVASFVSVAGLLVVPWLLRNVWLYGDITARAGFESVSGGIIQAKSFTLFELLRTSAELFRAIWIVWWKGASVASNPIIDAITVVVAGLCLLSLFALARTIRIGNHTRSMILFTYIVAIVICGVAVIGSRLTEWVPSPQGRLMLPVIIPIVLVSSYGLMRSRLGVRGVVAFILLLFVLDSLSLYGNLLPYHYYWSAFVVDGIMQHWQPQSLIEMWEVFYPRLMGDKPAIVLPILHALPILYMGMIAMVISAIRNAAIAASSSIYADTDGDGATS